MARREKIETEVEFRPKGLSELKAKWADFAGNLLEPVVMLAAGATKAQAAWAGFRGILEGKVLGPLGLVSGLATGFLLITRRLISEWRTLGVQSAKAIETLTLQFKPLLGSLELAKKRAREVFAFSVKSPFKFAELAEGNKILESLTRGALSSKKGMELVGDAAAVAGAGFEETARSVGRLYDGIMSGRPVGEAAMRLQELGLVSGQTRNQIEAMTAANASGSSIWAIVQKDLERTKGAMEDLSSSLEGLESTYEDTRTQLEAGFGQGFMKGEKAAIRSATQVMQAMTPAATYLGEQIGTVSNFFSELKESVVKAATSIPGFTSLMTGLAVITTGFAGAISLAAGGLILKFAMGLKSAAQSQQLLTAATVAGNAATTVGGVVTTQLISAKAALVAVMRSLQAGQIAGALANLRLAATETLVAIRTNGVAAAQIILRGALALTGRAIIMVTQQMVALSLAIMATPAFWIAAGMLAAGAAMLHFHNKSKKAREELNSMAAAARATVSNLRQQAASIRTLADLRKAEADAVYKQVEAYKELAAAQASGNKEQIAIARKKIEKITQITNEIRGKSGKTELDATEVEREDAAKQRAKEALTARDDDRAGTGEDSALAVARERKAKGDALMAAEQKMEAEEKRIAAAQEESRRKVEDRTLEEGTLQGRRKELIAGIVERSGADAASVSGRERAEMEIEKKLVEERLEAMRELKALEAKKVSDIALQSDSELAALNEKLRIYGELESAKSDYEKADEGLRTALDTKTKAVADSVMGNHDPDLDVKTKDALQAAMDAKERKLAAERAAAGAGLGGWESRDAQNAGRRVKEIKDNRAKNLDPVEAEARARAVRDAEVGLSQARIDAEAMVASLRLKGYEREAKLLDFERQKLQVAREKGKLDEESYQRQKTLLDEQQAAMEKAAGEKRGELEGALQISKLRREENEARLAGDGTRAEELRRQADAVGDDQARKDAVKEAADMGGSAADRADFVNRRVKEAQAARAAERKREEEERAAGRSRSEANQGSAVAAIEAERLKRMGKTKEARKVTEDAARKQDELDRAEAAKRYREQGFGADKADQMATRDVKISQAERLMQEMGGRGGGTVVASSLAKIGGGGNVAGTDPGVRLQERMVKLLEDIANAAKQDVDTYEP